MPREWVRVSIESDVDAGELMGLLDDPAITGAWQENGILSLYWPAEQWTEETWAKLREALRGLTQSFGDYASASISVSRVPERDWNEEWARSVTPIRVGRRLVIRPSWKPVVLEPGQIELILDPKQAFGTGHHATTSLLLEWLEEAVRGGERLLDLGTGTGILAMAALRLGAASVLAIDHDPVAIDCARAYAAENGFGAELDLRVGTPDQVGNRTFDLVLANLDCQTIVSLAPVFPGILNRNGTLLLSGILAEDAEEVLEAMKRSGGRLVETRERDQWLAMAVRFAAGSERPHG